MIGATEGGNVELVIDFSGLTGVEYWVEELSAEEGDDYTGTLGSSTSWEQVTSPGSVYFAAVDDSAVETTQSFKVHVRPIDHPTDESELEADILDNDARTFTASVAAAEEGDYVTLTLMADETVDLECWVGKIKRGRVHLLAVRSVKNGPVPFLTPLFDSLFDSRRGRRPAPNGGITAGSETRAERERGNAEPGNEKKFSPAQGSEAQGVALARRKFGPRGVTRLVTGRASSWWGVL
ncbi:MAG: hypothetical protein SFU86_08950 [Pirellulaceae bacterium]|nr:hypothetical protein [Pirellulaceae bacterium]